MEKSREAFRTISEVAEWLDVPTHVLRFWESRFSQIKPVKRAGGRRYYRPSDMRVIGGVKTLLHDQGMTIRGVQKLFREQGVKHISSYSPGIFGEGSDAGHDEQVIEHETVPAEPGDVPPSPSARSTHDASPDPVVEKERPVAESEELVFIPSRRGARAETEEVVEAEAQPEPAPEPPDQPEPEMPEAPVIPATPEIPETDPSDDDPAHAAVPRVGAHLLTARRTHLRTHKDKVAQVVERLKDIRARLN